MRKPLEMDDVEDLEFRAHTPDDHRTMARTLVDWAAEQHPDDGEEVTPAMLLVKAGEQLGFADDPTGALELFRRAQTADGKVPPDVRCYLHHGLIQAGDLDGARGLAEALRRAKPTDPNVYAFIAEDYDLAGDLSEANRWLNLGLRRLIAQADGEDLSDPDALMLLAKRRRVRSALGFPPDEFDENPLLLPPLDLPE